MYQSVSFYDFTGAFHAHDRDRQFSYEAMEAIFEMLEALEEDTGVPVELDVIAICCEYTESKWFDIAREYNIDCEGLDLEESIQKVDEYLSDNTGFHQLIGDDQDTFVFQQF
jgi:predicted ArsR family transcriptional regulator